MNIYNNILSIIFEYIDNRDFYLYLRTGDSLRVLDFILKDK